MEQEKVQVSENVIRKILDNLNVFKTLGPEEMYIEILKWLNTISVCQLSLKNLGKLGDAKKSANRIPFFKKGETILLQQEV